MGIPAGIAELDAAWLRLVLGEAGDARAQRIREVRAERIGEGYGLDGVVARVATTDDGGSEHTLVAKWCRAEVGAHEARFYREVAPRLGLDRPRLLASEVAAEGAVLLLEDVAPARQGDAIVGATPEEADRLMDELAALHARGRTVRGEPGVAWLPRWGQKAEERARQTAERLPGFLDRWRAELSPRVLAAAERLPQVLVGAFGRLMRAADTVIHVDLHLDNVLFLPDGAPVIIDWAQAAIGPGIVDVGRLLVEGMTSATRRAITKRLSARYVDGLAARGVPASVPELDAQMGDLLTVMLSGAIRTKEPVPGSPARLVPVIENLVRNVAAAIDDRAGTY